MLTGRLRSARHASAGKERERRKQGGTEEARAHVAELPSSFSCTGAAAHSHAALYWWAENVPYEKKTQRSRGVAVFTLVNP